MTLNRNAIVERVAEKTGLPKKAVKEVLKAFEEVIREEVYTNKNTVTLGRFGKFYPRIQEARTYTTPRGDKVSVPRRTVVRFKPYKGWYEK